MREHNVKYEMSELRGLDPLSMLKQAQGCVFAIFFYVVDSMQSFQIGEVRQ